VAGDSATHYQEMFSFHPYVAPVSQIKSGYCECFRLVRWEAQVALKSAMDIWKIIFASIRSLTFSIDLFVRWFHKLVGTFDNWGYSQVCIILAWM